MRLSAEDAGAVVAERRRRKQQTGTRPTELLNLQRELKRWQRLFTLGEIEEADYKREASSLRLLLAELDRPTEVLDVEQAVSYVKEIGRTWQESEKQPSDEPCEVPALLLVNAVAHETMSLGSSSNCRPRGGSGPAILVGRPKPLL